MALAGRLMVKHFPEVRVHKAVVFTVMYFNVLYHSKSSHPDAAVEGARRGSRIWLRLGEDLHRRSWRYELLRAELELVLHA